jgi:hypothetical protein
MRKSVLAVTTAVLAAPLAGPLAAASSATGASTPRMSETTLVDPGEDVWVWSEGTSSWELWGTKENADALGATIEHGTKVIHIRYTFDNLRRRCEATYEARIKTKKMVRTAWVLADSGTGWGGTHRLTKGTGTDEVDAPGFRHHIDYQDDTVTFTLPRDLFKNPAWVKVMLSNELDGSHLYTDNPHNETAEPVFTAKIHTP